MKEQIQRITSVAAVLNYHLASGNCDHISVKTTLKNSPKKELVHPAHHDSQSYS